MDEPIRVFKERRLLGSRTFRLFPNSVELETSSGSMRFPLEQVLREPVTGKTIDAVPRRLSWIALACTLGLVLFISVVGPSLSDQSFPRDLRLAIAIAKLALLVVSLLLLIPAAFWSPKYEFAMFQTGPDSPLFHISDVNRTGLEFQDFVRALIEQIRACQAENQGSGKAKTD
jgi:hypothetical protein